MKPHIRYSHLFRRWTCWIRWDPQGECYGYGQTPERAYVNWWRARQARHERSGWNLAEVSLCEAERRRTLR